MTRILLSFSFLAVPDLLLEQGAALDVTYDIHTRN